MWRLIIGILGGLAIIGGAITARLEVVPLSVTIGFIVLGVLTIGGTIFEFSIRRARRRDLRGILFWSKRWGVSWWFGRFLWISGKLNGLRLISFDATGRNNTRGPLRNLDGYLENLKSGERVPLYIQVGGIPQKLSDVKQIEAGIEFTLRAPFGGSFGATFGEGPHLSVVECWRKWPSFRFVFEYNGEKFSKKFRRRRVSREIMKRQQDIARK